MPEGVVIPMGIILRAATGVAALSLCSAVTTQFVKKYRVQIVFRRSTAWNMCIHHNNLLCFVDLDDYAKSIASRHMHVLRTTNHKW